MSRTPTLDSASGVKKLASGEYTVTSADASANASAIVTGLKSIDSVIVQVKSSGNNVLTSDADITHSGGTITVADGSTYNTTAGYIVSWLAVGA